MDIDYKDEEFESFLSIGGEDDDDSDGDDEWEDDSDDDFENEEIYEW